nr:hypothetical protein BaRGS_011190 [Batillaria attramentaria]
MEALVLAVLAVVFAVAQGKIGFIKDQSMDATFPPPVFRQDPAIPEGHLRPLGWQRRSDGPVKEIEEMPNTREFYNDYVKFSKPVVVRNGITEAPALSLWESDDYLQTQYGKVNVTVTVKVMRKKDEVQTARHVMKLKKFLYDYMYEDWYLASTVPVELLPKLPLPKCLRCGSLSESLQEAELWMSSGGTSSRLHSHDDHNLHCVLFGRRDFILIEKQFKANFAYQQDFEGSVGGHSKLDMEMVNAFKFKNILMTPWTWSTLYPGDCILVPAATASDFGSPHCATGRTTIVELFEWRWDDVAAECERFLGPMGFCGVQVRNCRYEGRADLRLSKDYVRGKLAEFMNNLITIGVAGFRVDSAKHMWPGDLENIFGRLQVRLNLKSDVFGSNKRPFIYQHVPDYDDNEAIRAYEYTNNGRVTNFRFGKYLNDVFRRQNALKQLGEGWNMPASDDVLNFIDNHDNQRDTSAGSVLTYKQSRLYKMATAFMLAWPYGVARVMSSYNFTDATQVNMGPPSTNEVTDRVVINGDGGCDGGWVCEHRWRQVYNMVAFRNVAGSEPVANWWTGADYQIAFSRGNRTFIAFNLESFDFKATLQTGLPAGWYCDVISGHLDNDKCTGATVIVREDGTAKVSIWQKIGNEVKTLG